MQDRDLLAKAAPALLRGGERNFLPYDMEGPEQPEMEWLPISYDRGTGQGSYLMRMGPGAVTIPHDHQWMEEFLILEGELMDSSGSLFKAGDFISYPPGSHHNSWTGPGCVIMVVEWPSLEQQRAARDPSAQGGLKPGGSAGDGLISGSRGGTRPE